MCLIQSGFTWDDDTVACNPWGQGRCGSGTRRQRHGGTHWNNEPSFAFWHEYSAPRALWHEYSTPRALRHEHLRKTIVSALHAAEEHDTTTPGIEDQPAQRMFPQFADYGTAMWKACLAPSCALARAGVVRVVACHVVRLNQWSLVSRYTLHLMEEKVRRPTYNQGRHCAPGVAGPSRRRGAPPSLTHPSTMLRRSCSQGGRLTLFSIREGVPWCINIVSGGPRGGGANSADPSGGATAV